MTTRGRHRSGATWTTSRTAPAIRTERRRAARSGAPRRGAALSDHPSAVGMRGHRPGDLARPTAVPTTAGSPTSAATATGRLVPIAHLTLLDPEGLRGGAEARRRRRLQGRLGRAVHPHPQRSRPPGPRRAVAYGGGARRADRHPPDLRAAVVDPRALRQARPCRGEFHYNVTLRQGVQQALLTFLDYGTLERFPTLRLGILESGMGWLGAFLDRCDAVFDTISRPRGADHDPSRARSSPASASSRATPTRPPRRCCSSTSARTCSCGRPTTRIRTIPRRGSTR